MLCIINNIKYKIIIQVLSSSNSFDVCTLCTIANTEQGDYSLQATDKGIITIFSPQLYTLSNYMYNDFVETCRKRDGRGLEGERGRGLEGQRGGGVWKKRGGMGLL